MSAVDTLKQAIIDGKVTDATPSHEVYIHYDEGQRIPLDEWKTLTLDQQMEVWRVLARRQLSLHETSDGYMVVIDRADVGEPGHGFHCRELTLHVDDPRVAHCEDFNIHVWNTRDVDEAWRWFRQMLADLNKLGFADEIEEDETEEAETLAVAG